VSTYGGIGAGAVPLRGQELPDALRRVVEREKGIARVQARSALVLDDEGGFLALTAAESSSRRFTVEIVTTHPAVGAEIDPTQQPFVFRRIALAGVVVTPHMTGQSSDGDRVTLRNIYTRCGRRRCPRRDRGGVVGCRKDALVTP
jgi:hypothetical protein